MTAAQTATPTPHARETIIAAHHSRRHVAIVSNNSEPAIRAYLKVQRLTAYVDAIVGRTFAQPPQMKPNPAPILNAAHATAVPPLYCVVVGDSPSDVEAARAAGSAVIGYANKPGKRLRLTHADVIIETMADLADALFSAEPAPVPNW